MRTALAVLILLAAAWQLGADWKATIGQGYAFRPGTGGAIMAAHWPEGHARLIGGFDGGVGRAVRDFLFALPAALLFAAAGYGLWISRPAGRRR